MESEPTTSPMPPIIPPERKDGSERIHGDVEAIPSTLRDFWSWAYSDLLSNALRGVLAEYIVGLALGCIGPRDTRLEWDAYDLDTADGLHIEVKSTAHLQSWGPAKPRSLSFRIGKTQAWNARTNEYSSERKRQGDVYVFCLFTATDRASADPLDVRQWQFFVASTSLLNEKFPEYKSLSVSTLRRTEGVAHCGFTQVRAAVAAAAPSTRIT